MQRSKDKNLLNIYFSLNKPDLNKATLNVYVRIRETFIYFPISTCTLYVIFFNAIDFAIDVFLNIFFPPLFVYGREIFHDLRVRYCGCFVIH